MIQRNASVSSPLGRVTISTWQGKKDPAKIQFLSSAKCDGARSVYSNSDYKAIFQLLRDDRMTKSFSLLFAANMIALYLYTYDLERQKRINLRENNKSS